MEGGEVKKLKALDLFCGAGGASMGLNHAGFEVTGVDISPQPNYPFEFIQADALEISLKGFDFIWASPPCQAYSPLNAYNKKEYPDLISHTRRRLIRANIPFVIENVVQAPLKNPIILCGTMFDLFIYRHRAFENSFSVTVPKHLPHKKRCSRNGYTPSKQKPFMTITGGRHSKEWTKCASKYLQVPWMKDIREVCEAIPPAYSEFIGKEWIKQNGN